MKTFVWMSTLLGPLLAALSMSGAASAGNVCENAKGVVEGFNCKIPEDATGQPIYWTEKVMAKVIWVHPKPDAHGFYRFTAAFSHFQTDGTSRIRPVIDDDVEITIRALIYPGLLKRD
jgi:hypothetical protein